MEPLDKGTFITWMERLLNRLDELQGSVPEVRKRPVVEGEPLIDNQEVCQMLQISKRTLQRYRDSGTMPFHRLFHKTWYKESEVIEFMKTHFTENLIRKRARKQQ